MSRHVMEINEFEYEMRHMDQEDYVDAMADYEIRISEHEMMYQRLMAKVQELQHEIVVKDERIRKIENDNMHLHRRNDELNSVIEYWEEGNKTLEAQVRMQEEFARNLRAQLDRHLFSSDQLDYDSDDEAQIDAVFFDLKK